MITRIHARDEDKGRLGRVKYSLEDSGGIIHIDSDSGDVTLTKELDYERRQNYA